VSLLDVLPVSLPAYVTVRQLADWLQCCPQTVRNWSRRGVLPPPLALSKRKQLWDTEAVRGALARLQAQR
jgi:predicted site-specific integrase-resolvase